MNTLIQLVSLAAITVAVCEIVYQIKYKPLKIKR